MCTRSGSPPHPLGISMETDSNSLSNRFTPASAGNIRLRPCPGSYAWVHPRIRGEYSVWIVLAVMFQGSPPHPRGILTVWLLANANSRFTPASAGNIYLDKLDANRGQVHPRIRGEYPFHINQFFSSQGSPPHPRGISGLCR